MKNFWKAALSLLSCGMAAALICAGLFLEPSVGEGDRRGEHTVLYANGDQVYMPPTETLACDSDSGTLYYEKILDVYPFLELSEKDKEELAASVNGTIVGDISGTLNLLQLQVKETELAELEALAKKLMESEKVLYASCEIPMELMDNTVLGGAEALQLDKNPWKGERDRGDEENPGGSDWWAEAIGAYTAWQYTDEIQKSVKAGVMDSGFFPEHEEFLDKNGNSKISFPEGYGENTRKSTHGTHVAGIVAANDNKTGIRGVADRSDLICVDHRLDIEDFSTYGTVMEATKQMLEEGARVINNSWGYAVYDKTNYSLIVEGKDLEKDEPGVKSLLQYVSNNATGAYDDYFERMTTSYPRATSSICMTMMVQLLCQGKEDFLFTVAAGNGWNNDGTKGYDVKWSNFYAAITRENFEGYLQPSTIENLERNRGITFDTLREHLLVVAAVENKRAQGRYSLTGFSNFGSNVDIAAPGEGILSCLSDAKDAYGELRGTSMAAPMVTGSATLVWSVNPDLSAAEVKELLLETAGTAVGVTGEDAGREYPMLNVGAAVKRALQERDSLTSKETASGEEEDLGESRAEGELYGSLQPDTSKGDYRLSQMLELNGWLYYPVDEGAEGINHRFSIYRRRVDGSGGEEVFLSDAHANAPGVHDRISYGRLMATEQYLYVVAAHPAKNYPEQYTPDGRKVGEIPLPGGGEFVWEDGYFFYVRNERLYRMKAESKSSEEALGDDQVVFGFQVYGGNVYYVTNETIRDGRGCADFVSLSWDGVGRQVVCELNNSALYEELGKGLIHGDGIYFRAMDYDAGGEALCRVGLDGSVQTVLSEERSGGCAYSTDNEVIPVGRFPAFIRLESVQPCTDDAIGVYDPDAGEERLLLLESEAEEGCSGYTPVFVQNASGLYFWKNGNSFTGPLSFCRISADGSGMSDYGELFAG